MSKKHSKILKLLQQLCEEVKADDIKSYDVTNNSSITDYYFVCTGNSDPHIKAIKEKIIIGLKEHKIAITRTEATQNHWAVIDLDFIIIHIFQPSVRTFYQVDKLWRERKQNSATAPWLCPDEQVLAQDINFSAPTNKPKPFLIFQAKNIFQRYSFFFDKSYYYLKIILKVFMRFLFFIFLLSTLAQKAVDYQTKSISYILSGEPPSLDSMLQATSVGVFVLGHTNEGLLTYSPRGKIIPAIAKKYKITNKGAIFYLRDDCFWSDATPVTAKDFVFAWREVVNPKKASRYAFIMYPIKNARKINQGVLPLDKLGVRAKDDYTLEVEFERPCAYFEQLVAFQVYYPVNEHFYKTKGKNYASSHKELLYNGPFIIEKWDHEKRLILRKNPLYYDKKNIHLNSINIYRMTNSNLTKLNEFLDGKNAITILDDKTLKIAEKNFLLMRSYSDGFLHYLEFNHRTNKLGKYKKFRQAIQAIYDADELVNRVVATPGNKLGHSFLPSWFKIGTTPFHLKYPLRKNKKNHKKAKRLLKQLRRELNLEKLPPITLLTSDSATAIKVSEYFQQLLNQELGLKVLIDRQTFKQRLEKSLKGEFDIVLTAWGPDYNDPMTFADLFASWNRNNRGKYKSDTYDQLVTQASQTIDKNVRFDAFGKMQQIIEDDAVIIPLYENGSIYVQHPKLRGVLRPTIGPNPWFKFATVKQ